MKILYSLLDSFRIIFLLFSKHASGYIKPAPLYFFICRNMPLVGQGLLIHDVSKSHSTIHHRRYDSSSRVISSSQRPLPDNTQHSEQTFILGPRGFRVQSQKHVRRLGNIFSQVKLTVNSGLLHAGSQSLPHTSTKQNIVFILPVENSGLKLVLTSRQS